MFKVGDKVCYPNHGIGIIKEVKEYEISGEKMRFFTVLILDSKSTVKVPASNAVAVGLRNLITEQEARDVFAYLRGSDLVRYDDWKERFKQNSDLMRTGKITDMQTVLKNLHFVSLEKPLSFREKRMYERALHLVSSEIAEVRKTAPNDVEGEILGAISHAVNALGVQVED